MAVILGESVQSSERFRLTLGAETKVVPTPRELLDYVDNSPFENLIIVAPEISLNVATEIAKHYRAVRPSLGVVLIRNRLEVTVLSKAMQSGVREVVSADDASELLAAARRSQVVSEALTDKTNEIYSSNPNKGKMVLVFSAKGGCGKTTVSTNLAEALARDPDRKVALLDFDLQFGDVAVALQLDPTKTISDAIRMQHSLDQQGVRSLMTKYKDNIDVLIAPLDPSDVEFITPDLAQKILRVAKDSYDFVVVDAPPAFTEVILRAFDMADAYVLLTTLDTPSLKNLKVTLGTLQALGMPKNKWNVVVNRSTAKAGLNLNDVQEAIGMAISATIPSSDIVPISVNQGKTVVDLEPKHPVAKAMMDLATLVGGAVLAKRQSVFGRAKHRKA